MANQTEVRENYISINKTKPNKPQQKEPILLDTIIRAYISNL